jgi:thiamine-phosphate pyrophosphorylase
VVDVPRLVALSPGQLGTASDSATLAFLGALERALGAGLPGVLLREPRLGDRAFLALGARVRAACAGAWLAVHDRPHLAAALRADAVHLGFRALAPGEIRPWLPADIALGLSTHAHDDPRGWESADYLFHGPLHATPSKAVRVEPVGAPGLARALAATTRPLLALGGVTPADVPRVRRLGAHGVAVRAGILCAADPAGATRAYLTALAGAALA